MKTSQSISPIVLLGFIALMLICGFLTYKTITLADEVASLTTSLAQETQAKEKLIVENATSLDALELASTSIAALSSKLSLTSEELDDLTDDYTAEKEKNDNFEGWKTFGDDNAEAFVRGIRFPISSNTLLGSTLKAQSATEGSYGSHPDDATFLGPLNYGQPDRMHAMPLVARGRGVAVLYADYGAGGTSVNVEALETLVSISGLTVELLASTQTAKIENREMVATDFENARREQVEVTRPEAAAQAEPEVVYQAEPVAEHATDFAFTESQTEAGAGSPFTEPVEAEPTEAYGEITPEIEALPVEEVTAFEPVEDFQPGEVIYDRAPESSPFDSAADLEPAIAGIGGVVHAKSGVDTAVEISPANVGRATRRSERTVDLPIEVTEAERRPHNDARRFARLLVSEIKLYNEQRVTEGRQSNDLYQRLRDSIDRSREMYDKRVQPPVAERFDYFHYELVNSLADGSPERLGAGYPGSSV